jgi:hypothetical protein
MQCQQEIELLLERHLLSGLIEAPWVRTNDPKSDDDDRFFAGLQELMSYAFEESVRIKKKDGLFPRWHEIPVRSSRPPVISTIVMLRLLAQRQRASMSAYFTNSLTPPSDLGLLALPCAAGNPGRAARGSVVPRKVACRPAARGETFHSRFKAINSRTREGQPGRCPFLIGSGNGRQDAQSCFARRPVALLRRLRLDFGSLCFGFCLFRARGGRRHRDSLRPMEPTWKQLVLKRARAARLPACPASGVRFDPRAAAE